MSFAPIEAVIEAIGRGGMAVVVDDEGRENEGDLICAAEHVTPEVIGFMVRHTSGVVCASITNARADELQLPLMVDRGSDHQGTAFTVSVDARNGISTGISASDRAATIRALVDPATAPSDLVRPGHVFPLRSRDGGVLCRPGHTEAAVDLAKLAGLAPAGVLAEVVRDDGSMARLPELEEFAERHGLPMTSVAELISHRRRRERFVTRVSKARIGTSFGDFLAYGYSSTLDRREHLALVKGRPWAEDSALVRVHSECLTGDVFGSTRCDCGAQLQLAMERITAIGHGAIVYVRGHEGRSIGLGQKLRAYELQDVGLDTVEANVALGLPVDARDYATAAEILLDLGIERLRLLTNNPAKERELGQHGLEIADSVPLVPELHGESFAYVATKRCKLGHRIHAGDLRLAGSGPYGSTSWTTAEDCLW